MSLVKVLHLLLIISTHYLIQSEAIEKNLENGIDESFMESCNHFQFVMLNNKMPKITIITSITTQC